MIKKQTVWLLTMLSLMVVLTVYYITSDKENMPLIDNEMALSDSDAEVDELTDETGVEMEDIQNVGLDEYFAMLRLELQDNRSMKIDRLREIVASSAATAEEKNEALNSIDELDDVKTKEYILEETIHSLADYEDVLVRSEENKVHVHIKTVELSNEEVVQIMQLVRDEFGDITVDVSLQTS